MRSGPKTSGTRGNRWTSILSNRRVARYHTTSGATGGYSEKTQFDLCGDGTFYRKFRASSVSGSGDGVMSNKAAGTWSVQGNQLILLWVDGEASQHLLEDRGGQLFVDGERWLLAGAACQ